MLKQMCDKSIIKYFIFKCSKSVPTCLDVCEQILSCGHPCKRKCGETCGGCEVLVESLNQMKCGHPQMVLCGEGKETIGILSCNQKCGKVLGCGHTCNLICGKDCLHGKLHGPCKEPCKRRLICGHECNGKNEFVIESGIWSLQLFNLIMSFKT